MITICKKTPSKCSKSNRESVHGKVGKTYPKSNVSIGYWEALSYSK